MATLRIKRPQRYRAIFQTSAGLKVRSFEAHSVRAAKRAARLFFPEWTLLGVESK